jgi:hypothetical protein
MTISAVVVLMQHNDSFLRETLVSMFKAVCYVGLYVGVALDYVHMYNARAQSAMQHRLLHQCHAQAQRGSQYNNSLQLVAP